MIELLWIKSLFHFAIILLCFIIIAFLNEESLKNLVRRKLLIGFLLVIILIELAGLLRHTIWVKDYLLIEAPILLQLHHAFGFAYIPLFYFYIISLTNVKWIWKRAYFLHWIPFILVLGIVVFVSSIAESISHSINVTLYAFVQLQFISYAIAAMAHLHNHKSGKIYRQLIPILTGLIIWKLIHLFEFFAWAELSWINETSAWILYVIAEFVFLVFISKMFLVIIRNPGFFLKSAIKGKYEKTLLTDLQRTQLQADILNKMESEKLYLNPDLSLEFLADQVSVPPYQLSQTINSVFKTNFYEFVNQYRIKESKLLLSSEHHKDKTILEILYACGFNSKSVFNNSFKKQTGMTPTHYRNATQIMINEN